MVPQLRDEQRVSSGLVHHPMLVVNPPGPPPSQPMPQGLRLAEAFMGMPPRVCDQGVDALQDLGLGGLPVEVVLPGQVRKDELHGGLLRLARQLPRGAAAPLELGHALQQSPSVLGAAQQVGGLLHGPVVLQGDHHHRVFLLLGDDDGRVVLADPLHGFREMGAGLGVGDGVHGSSCT